MPSTERSLPPLKANTVERVCGRTFASRGRDVYRLVAADTVEKCILEMQAKKQALADATVDGESGALAGMTADELLGLFATREP